MPRSQFRHLRPRIGHETFARWGTRGVLLLLLLLAGGLMVGFVRMTWTQHQINQASERQRAENEAQQARNAALKGEAEFRESDVYAEQAAREQLGMAREGDIVLKPTLLSQAASPAPTPAPAPSVPPAPAAAPIDDGSPPNHQRWWQAFFPAN